MESRSFFFPVAHLKMGHIPASYVIPNFMTGQPTNPPGTTYPLPAPKNKALLRAYELFYSFPLIRPAIKPLFLRVIR